MENNLEQNKPIVEDTNILLIGYLLCLAMIFTGITVFIAGILAFIQKKETQTPWMASHWENIWHTFVWLMIWSVTIAIAGFILTVISFGLLVFVPVIAGLILTVWFYYRMIRGVIIMNRREFYA
jgi:Predicted membrane protein